MKIRVGKAYEGGSSIRLKDGTYELQILKIESTRGRVNMTLSTSDGHNVYKTFFLLDKDGKKENERGMMELADYITTAMQIEEEEAEVKVESAVGCYLKCYVKNGSYEKTDGTEKKVYNLDSPERCSGFSDGTPSLLKESSDSDEEEGPEDDGEESYAQVTEEEDLFNKYLNS